MQLSYLEYTAVMCIIGAIVVKANMLNFQLIMKHIVNPPIRDKQLRSSAESIQLTGSAIDETSLVSLEVSCSQTLNTCSVIVMKDKIV